MLALRILPLIIAVTSLQGCATSADTMTDPSMDMTAPASQEDESHGWGASVGNVSGH